MPQADQPAVLLTRPLAASMAFLDQLRQENLDFESYVSPAFEIQPTEAKLPSFEQVVFTSTAAVEFAPEGNARVAWCVGAKTAAAAQAKGFHARSSDGDVSDLLKMILRAFPTETLLHIRGETSVGNVAAELAAKQIDCKEIISYKKTKHPPARFVRGLIKQDRPILMPVFSAETVSIIDEWRLEIRRLWIVAISQHVADAASVLRPEVLRVADAPNAAAMLRATTSLIA